MRSTVLAAVLAFASIWGNGLLLANSIHWISKHCDFGALDEDLGKVTGTFRFVNRGTSPATIVSARANCGCTTPTYSHHPIMPGDTGAITVGFDPNGRPGRFTKYVNIDIDDGQGPVTRSKLEISGVVIGGSNTLASRYPVKAGKLRLRSSLLPFNEVLKGKASIASLAGINSTRDTIIPQLDGLPEYIKASISPKEIGPGEMFAISAILNSAMTDQWGVITDDFLLDSAQITLTAVIREDFSSLSPQETATAPIVVLSSNNIDFKPGEPLKGEIKITNAGKRPLIIRALKTDSKTVTAKIKNKKIAPGKTAKLYVAVDRAQLCDRYINNRVTLITNDLLHPTQSIRVTGELK